LAIVIKLMKLLPYSASVQWHALHKFVALLNCTVAVKSARLCYFA